MKALPPLVVEEIESAAALAEQRRVLTTESLDRWDALAGFDPAETLDTVAFWVACRFHAELLTYEAGDGLMNDLYGAVVETMHGQALATPSATHFNRPAKRSLPNGPEEPLWWRVYLAFDAGEYRRSPDEDPVALYTSPAIAEIVAELSGGATAVPSATS